MPPLGYSQLGYPQLGYPQPGYPQPGYPPAPVPFMGVPQLGFSPLGYPSAPAPYLGVPPQAFPSAPAPFIGMPPLGYPQLGYPQLGYPQPGYPQPGYPPAPVPYLGVPPQAFPPQGIPAAQALGLGMPTTPWQTTPWQTAGIGGHAVSPVVSMLLSQIGLREAVSKIGDDALKQRVTDSVNEAIDRTIEGVSGMTLQPWFGPAAQFTIYPIAAELALIAQRYQDTAVRNALLTIAGQILQRSIAPAADGVGRHK